MRAKNENEVLSVNAIAGTRVVLLGLNLKGYAAPTQNSSPSSLSDLLSKVTLSNENDGSHHDESAQRKDDASTTGSQVLFLGFSIERRDLSTNESISLSNKPIQKFLWGDYEVLPGKEYLYTIQRMTKQNKSSSRSKFIAYGPTLQVQITTEDPTDGKHGIYFNRGAAGSHAYETKFGDYRRYHLVEKYGHTHWKSIINPRSISPPEKSRQALAWLSRGLEEALLDFLSKASGKGYQLRAAVYEFTHVETIQAFADAVERGVDVKIIRHCKGTYHAKVCRNKIVTDEHGNVVKDWIPDETSDEAKKAIDKVGFHSMEHAHIWQNDTFIERRHTSAIMHNKFIILVKNGVPMEVWTGSVNFTDGGIYGQSNVAHIVRDSDVAKKYMHYWNALSKDPLSRKIGAKSDSCDSDNGEEVTEPMDEFNECLQPDLDGPISSSSPSTNVIFSPRRTSNMLSWYADRMGDAKSCVHFTEAFSVAQPIAQVLMTQQDLLTASCRTNGVAFIECEESFPLKSSSNGNGLRRSPRIAKLQKDRNRHDSTTPKSSTLLRYILLDAKPSKHSSNKFRNSAAKKGRAYVDYYDFKDINSNRIAYGAILPDDLNGKKGKQGSEIKHDDDEISTNGVELAESLTGLTTFVAYIHTKYMLIDALTDCPTVITGSANFSEASTIHNDENMLIIHGDTGVADVCVTEFMRLFDHFYSRDEYYAHNDNEAEDDKNEKRESDRSTVDWGEIFEDESWLGPYFDPSTQLYRERLLMSGLSSTFLSI